MKSSKLLITIFFLISSSISMWAQRFEFGLNLEAGLSQVEGDQLRGFSEPSFFIGVQGLYKLNSVNRIVVEPGFGYLGSKRSSESISRFFNVYLMELNLDVAYVGFYYNRDFIETWEGKHRLRLNVGLKMNNIIEANHTLISRTTRIRNDEQVILRGKWFPSVVAGFGLLSNRHFNLNFSYQHSMFNLLKEKIHNINNLTPFGIYLGLNFIIK